ncbi:MAG TPA: hypothetical protein PKA05_23760, partial [Roseiflexaceae bacterium]|nr:hypothetical protein [Roseiflexaceae bacterium]
MSIPASERVAQLITQGAEALRAGDRARAHDLLSQALRLDPQSEQAWLWLSGAVATDEQRRYCLQRVVALNPDNAAAVRGLAALGGATPPAPAATPARPASSQPVAPPTPAATLQQAWPAWLPV